MTKTLLIFIQLVFIFIPQGVNAQAVLKTLQGQTIPFSSLKGKWVFINYWASWCDTCLHEIPELNAFYQMHKPLGDVAFYGVNFDALPVDEQNTLIKKYDISYPGLSIDPASALNLGDITGVPVTFVFNPQGKLHQTLYGGQSLKDLNRVLG